MKTDRTIWVAYEQDVGFVTKSGYTHDFSKARVYNQKNHLTTSIGKSRIDNNTVVPVPINLTIDSEVMLMLTLGGRPVFD